MQTQYIKKCRSKKAFSNELFIYQSSFSYKPNLIKVVNPNTLFLELVEAVPYLDIADFTDNMVIQLAKVISSFHSLIHIEDKVMCHWDNQPRNILWSKKKERYYLVDFEDIRFAYPETDLAHLFLFWAEVMNQADFTARIKLFIANYQNKSKQSASRWKAEYNKAKARFDRRRIKHNKNEPIPNPDRLINRKLLSNLLNYILSSSQGFKASGTFIVPSAC